METTFEVKPIGLSYICDDCGKGEMRYIGDMKMDEGVSVFKHRCTNCKVERNFTKKYPIVDFVRI